jgi:hypothetical protein
MSQTDHALAQLNASNTDVEKEASLMLIGALSSYEEAMVRLAVEGGIHKLLVWLQNCESIETRLQILGSAFPSSCHFYFIIVYFTFIDEKYALLFPPSQYFDRRSISRESPPTHCNRLVAYSLLSLHFITPNRKHLECPRSC